MIKLLDLYNEIKINNPVKEYKVISYEDHTFIEKKQIKGTLESAIQQAKIELEELNTYRKSNGYWCRIYNSMDRAICTVILNNGEFTINNHLDEK